MNDENKIGLALLLLFIVGAVCILHGLGWTTRPAFLAIGMLLSIGALSTLAAMIRGRL